MTNRPWAALAALLLLLGVDRATKRWALERLADQNSVEVLPFLRWTYVENTGAAFGLGRARNGFFIALSLALLAALLHLRRRWPKDNGWLQWGALLVVAGAVGNLYDRIVYRFVVDFIDLRVWPVFNVADSCISVGACCLAWGLHLEDRKLKSQAAGS